MDALNRLTWAGQDAVQDGSYRPFNELLCLAYMEKMHIGVSPFHVLLVEASLSGANELKMHDDGEKDLGPDIASVSVGGAATMKFRIKSKYWTAKALTADNYDPERWVVPGSQAWKTRIAVNDLYEAGRTQEYEAAKNELVGLLASKDEQKRNNGPAVLSLELRHGDMVVMHGERIQKIYEVSTPSRNNFEQS